MKTPTLLAAAAIAILGLTTRAPAAVIIAGNVNLPGAACTFTVTHDIVLTVTQGQSIPSAFLVFDDLLFASDGTLNIASLSGGLHFTRSIGKETSSSASIYDTFPNGLGDMTARDVSLSFDPGTDLAAGEKLTILAGTYSFTGAANLSPHIAGTFTGQAFLADGHGNRLTPGVTLPVPEPTTALLATLAAAATLIRRRR